MGFVLECVDGLALVQVSDPALERDASTGAIRLEPVFKRYQIDRIGCDRETRSHGSAACNRRKEQDFVAVVEPGFPTRQRAIDRDLAAVLLVGETVPAGDFIVEFGGRLGGRLKRLGFAAGSFAKYRKVLCRNRDCHFDSSA
jgi:hypothetical protein